MTNYHENNRQSWNEATKQHHSHKPDMIKQYKNGKNNLFPEDMAILGNVKGKSLVHLQCNDGQDTLSIANHLGADVLGVDISDEAINFARKMSDETGIAGEFVRADIFDWCAENQTLYDVVYTGYGAINWISDIKQWARGIAKTLKPNGRLVMIEFHPILLMLEDDWELKYDYMGGKPYTLGGVGDYVGDDYEGNFQNPHPSYEFAWGIADVVSALLEAGLTLNHLEEYPYVNGWKPFPNMRQETGSRNYAPEDKPSMALMFSVIATKSS
ncbi:MAG: class I SAM-dependent methyltransferase [Phototrophicaceae bacterium]